jgi:hypothetical protein
LRNRSGRGRVLDSRRILTKPGLSALVLCASLACAGRAWVTTLLDSCGDDKVKFDVKTEAGQPLPAGPAEGEAVIIFIGNQNQMIIPFHYAKVRFGMDGTWAGTNKGDSYLALTVAPGAHHLCASWQSDLEALKKSVKATSFTAEAGQVYYFAGEIVPSRDTLIFNFSELKEDEGKYQVKSLKLSTSNRMGELPRQLLHQVQKPFHRSGRFDTYTHRT